MTWLIGWLIGPAFNKVKVWALAAAAGAAFLITFYFKVRRDARADYARKNAEETVRRVEKGSKGAQRARDAQAEGRAPEAGVRSRDGKWK